VSAIAPSPPKRPSACRLAARHLHALLVAAVGVLGGALVGAITRVPAADLPELTAWAALAGRQVTKLTGGAVAVPLASSQTTVFAAAEGPAALWV
jgi:hypothetical protein